MTSRALQSSKTTKREAKGGFELNSLGPTIMVELRNIRITGQMGRLLFIRAMDEHLEAIRVDLAVDIVAHLR
jgi:hypothetical protein